MTVETTTGFVFELEDRPGTLREVTQRIAKSGVNIDGIGALATGTTGTIELIPDRPDETRTALEDAGVSFEEVEALVADVPDRPGELDERLELLAREDINIEGLFPVSGSPSRLAFTVDDTEQAQTLLEG